MTPPDPNLVGKSSKIELFSATSRKLANFQEKTENFAIFEKILSVVGHC